MAEVDLTPVPSYEDLVRKRDEAKAALEERESEMLLELLEFTFEREEKYSNIRTDYTISITNKALESRFKDFSILIEELAPSGTVMKTTEKTIYEILEPGKNLERSLEFTPSRDIPSLNLKLISALPVKDAPEQQTE